MEYVTIHLTKTGGYDTIYSVPYMGDGGKYQRLACKNCHLKPVERIVPLNWSKSNNPYHSIKYHREAAGLSNGIDELQMS